MLVHSLTHTQHTNMYPQQTCILNTTANTHTHTCTCTHYCWYYYCYYHYYHANSYHTAPMLAKTMEKLTSKSQVFHNPLTTNPPTYCLDNENCWQATQYTEFWGWTRLVCSGLWRNSFSCNLRWPWTCSNPPSSAPQCWDYRSEPCGSTQMI